MKIFSYRFQTFSNSRERESKNRDESEFLNSSSVKRIEHKEYRRNHCLVQILLLISEFYHLHGLQELKNISLEKRQR